MNATKQRDAVAQQAKADSRAALKAAREITDPWYRAQALAHVLRYCEDHPIPIANEAADSAACCPDPYKRTAVRAWEIAALAERSERDEANTRLKAVMKRIAEVTPSSSRSEALLLLLHASSRISGDAATTVAEAIVRTSNADSHWRCQRAVVDAIGVLHYIRPKSAMTLSYQILDAKLKSKSEQRIAAGGSLLRDFFC
ncbi:MAG: hypothetical protein GY904_19555 [Planctomycetaceae bacterium]|jgi:hypothetical protein|nr:hypothetical protein [Planctomycetaceae bacterium]